MTEQKKDAQREKPARKTYRKPTVRTSTVYEKKALACAKTDPNEQLQCDELCTS